MIATNISSVVDSGFQRRLEKHISDYRAGEGHLSRDVGLKIRDKEHQVAELLAETNPQVLHLYSGYRTAGFAYDKQARFVNGLHDATKNMAAIKG